MATPEDAVTRAGDDGQPEVLVNKLFMVSGDGEVSVAVFSFEFKGIGENSRWKKYEAVLQLVPNSIARLDNGMILLKEIQLYPEKAYRDANDNIRRALDEIMSCNYILRPSDGALFPLYLQVDTDMTPNQP